MRSCRDNETSTLPSWSTLPRGNLDDCQSQCGRGLGTDRMVNTFESPLTRRQCTHSARGCIAVTKRYVVGWQAHFSCHVDSHDHRRQGETFTIPSFTRNVVSPTRSRFTLKLLSSYFPVTRSYFRVTPGQRLARVAHGGSGTGARRKRMPDCNHQDSG